MWNNTTDGESEGSMLWRRAGATFTFWREFEDDLRVQYFGIRFEPEGVYAILDAIGVPRPTPENLNSLTGRPAEFARKLSQAPPPIKPLEPSRYTPRPVGTLEQIAPELAAYRRPGGGYRLGASLAPSPVENVPNRTGNVPPETGQIVTTIEFDAWYAAQSPEIQAWGGTKLRQKCSEDHGGRRVLKKATDHVTKGRKTGRKIGSKNVPK